MSQMGATQTKTAPVKKASKSQRFLEAWGLLIAKADRALEKQGEDLREKYDKAKDKLTGTMKQPDAERRLQRLEGLMEQYASDPRFEGAVSAIGTKAVRFRGQILKKEVTDWTALYDQIGIETTLLLQRIDMAKKAEIAGRALAPKALTDAMSFVEDALATEKLTEAERKDFRGRLVLVKRDLVTAGGTDKKNRKDGMLDQTTDEAEALQQSVEQAIARHAQETDRLTQRKDALMLRLSSAGADPAGMQLRIEISGELRLAEGDIALGAYPAAVLKLDGAENKLNQLASTDRAMQTAMKPKEIEKAVKTQISYWEEAKKTAEDKASGAPGLIDANPQSKYPPAALKLAEEARNRAGKAIFLLRDVLFMVENAPGSAVVAAKKLFEYSDLMAVAIELLQRATAIARDPNSKDNGNITGDGSTDSEKQLAALKQQVDAKFVEVTTDCENAYKLVDPSGKASGEAMAAIAESRQRWEQIKGKAILADELDVPAYLAEIERIARQVAQIKDRVASGVFGPEDLAFETKVAKYREDMPKLEALALSIGEENSDRAVSLGLVARPPALVTKAEGLIRTQATKRGTATEVTTRIGEIDLVLNEIAALLLEAAKPPKTGGGQQMTAEELRKNCKLHMDNYTKSIDAVILALNDDIRIRSESRDERTARVAYGAALKVDMATIAAPLVSKDLALLQDVFGKLVAFERRVEAFENMAPGKKSDPGVPDFNKVLERAKKLQAKLTADPLAKRQEAMTTEVDELKRIIANVSALDPAATDKTLAGLEQTINKAIIAADKEHGKAKELAAKCDKLWPQLQTPKDKERKKKFASYYDDMIRRIQALRDEIKAKDSIGEALPVKSGGSTLTKCESDYAALEKEVTAALATQESVWKDACTKGQAKSQEDDKKIEQMKYRFDSMREVDIKLLKEKASEQTGEAKAELKKQIDDTDKSIALALKELEKTRNVDAAKEMADSLASRLKRLADAPYGKSTRARNNLKDVEARWKKAVGLFGTSLDKAGQSIKSTCAGDPEAEKAAAALALKLDEIKTLFQADAFSAMIKRMSGPKPPAAEIAAAREDGLREVRRLNRAMNAHPTLRQLANIPFDDAALPLGEIGSALWDLETNLTISG